MLQEGLKRIALDPGFPGVRIYARVSGLRTYLSLLDEFVPHMQAQVTVRFAADLKRRGIQADDLDLGEELTDLQVLTDHHIGGSFYGAFVLALSAELEFSIQDIADYVRMREQSSLSLNDLREPSMLKRITIYAEALLREALEVPSSAQTGLTELQVVRNILAHANGALAGQKQGRIDEVRRIAERSDSLTVDEGYLLVQPLFLKKSLEHLDDYLTAVLAQVARRYPLSSIPAP